jgi:hypothetical protein
MASTSALTTSAAMTASDGGPSAARCSVERRGGCRSTCPTSRRMMSPCSQLRLVTHNARNNEREKKKKKKTETYREGNQPTLLERWSLTKPCMEMICVPPAHRST